MQKKRDVIKNENILFNLKVENYNETIEELTKILYKNKDVKNKEEFIKAVLERENEVSTNIGDGIAIPHGKSDNVNNSTVALAVLKEPINWKLESEEKVKYVFMLAIKEEDKGNEHLRILAELSSHLMDDSFIKEFKSAKNETEIFKIINKLGLYL